MFLIAIAKLRLMIKGVEQQSEEISATLKSLAESLKQDIALRKKAEEELDAATKDKQLADQELKDASELLAEQKEQQKNQEKHLDELDSISDKAHENYKKALKTFDTHFIAGTKLSLLEDKKEHPSFFEA